MIIIRRGNVPDYPSTNQSHKVAQEHYRWARIEQGLSDEAILHSIGLVSSNTPNPRAVIDALRRTWLAMQCGWRIELEPMRRAAE